MTSPAAEEIYQIIQKRRASRSSNNATAEQTWIADHLSDPQLSETARGLSIIAMHVLSALESGESTGIDLAKRLNVTRGGVTRAAKKLEKYSLISANHHADDRKKIFYSLTDNGRQIAQVHDKMHQHLKDTLMKAMTAKYSEKQLQLVANFLKDLSEEEAHI